MKTKVFRLLAVTLVICLSVSCFPILPGHADALTVSIDAINGNKTVSGSYIWTQGTFDAMYWIAIEAERVSYNVYAVEAIYPSGTKSVTVSGTDILLVVHNSSSQITNASKIALGDILTLYNINLETGSCTDGYVRVASSNGLTVSQGSSVGIDYSEKTVSGIGYGTTAGVLKTHFTEATSDLVVKDASGRTVSDDTVLGSGFTIQSANSGAYTIMVAGDADKDGAVTTADYQLIQYNIINNSNSYYASQDANGDGSVTTTDMMCLKLYIKNSATALLPSLSPLTKTEPEEVVVPALTLNSHSVTYKASEVSGTHSGTVISGGNLTLASGSTSGTFTTDIQDIGTFTMMVASWNAVTNGGKVSMAVSFQVSSGSWSSYFSWGTWSSSSGVCTSTNSSDTYGTMDVDTLTVKSGYTANGKIRIRLTLTKYNGGVPVVKNFSVATPQMATKINVNTSALPSYYLNNVPMRSQLAAANGSIGNIICSPTCTSMALEYLGTTVASLTAAKAMYDISYDGYGNWSFAAAYAGEKGYYTYIDFYDIDMIKYALSKGVVLGCATSLTSSGHIVLVVGYTVIDGVEYLIVNDPNVSESNIKRTNYSVSYFSSKFIRSDRGNKGIVYVFQGDYDLNS